MKLQIFAALENCVNNGVLVEWCTDDDFPSIVKTVVETVVTAVDAANNDDIGSMVIFDRSGHRIVNKKQLRRHELVFVRNERGELGKRRLLFHLSTLTTVHYRVCSNCGTTRTEASCVYWERRLATGRSGGWFCATTRKIWRRCQVPNICQGSCSNYRCRHGRGGAYARRYLSQRNARRRARACRDWRRWLVHNEHARCALVGGTSCAYASILGRCNETVRANHDRGDRPTVFTARRSRGAQRRGGCVRRHDQVDIRDHRTMWLWLFVWRFAGASRRSAAPIPDRNVVLFGASFGARATFKVLEAVAACQQPRVP